MKIRISAVLALILGCGGAQGKSAPRLPNMAETYAVFNAWIASVECKTPARGVLWVKVAADGTPTWNPSPDQSPTPCWRKALQTFKPISNGRAYSLVTAGKQTEGDAPILRGPADSGFGTAQPQTQATTPAVAERPTAWLPKDAIRQVVQQNVSHVKHCYEWYLNVDETTAGRLSVKFIIAEDGSIAKVSSHSTTLPRAVQSCVRGYVAGWKFPKPKGGGIVIVTYPFMLTRPPAES